MSPPANAPLDPGVLNLLRFVGALAMSTEQVHTSAAHFTETRHTLEGLAKDAQHDGDALVSEVQQVETALQKQGADVQGTLTDLTHEATAGQQKADTAKDALQQKADSVEETTQMLAAHLEGHHSTLTSEGFDALAHAADEAGQELNTQGQETEMACTELQASAKSHESEAQGTWEAAESDLGKAASALGEGETALERHVSDDVHGFESAAAEFESYCSSLGEELGGIYDALRAGVDTESEELQRAVHDGIQQAVQFVTTADQDRLHQPATKAHDELVPLNQEYIGLAAVLGGAAATVTELHPLSADLTTSRQVVDQVDELMKALGG